MGACMSSSFINSDNKSKHIVEKIKKNMNKKSQKELISQELMEKMNKKIQEIYSKNYAGDLRFSPYNVSSSRIKMVKELREISKISPQYSNNVPCWNCLTMAQNMFLIASPPSSNEDLKFGLNEYIAELDSHDDELSVQNSEIITKINEFYKTYNL